jgi:hypothetical protein
MRNTVKKLLGRLSEHLGVAETKRTLASIRDLEVERFLQQHLYQRSDRDPKWLGRFEAQIYSQSGEDGVLAEIFRRIGTTNRHFVEFGVGNGLENNTAALLLTDWTGLWLEGSDTFYHSIAKTFAPVIATGQLKAHHAFITAENIEQHLRDNDVPEELDLLSIDIDGNDYWVWRAITAFKPRVVVIEYNATLGPAVSKVMPYAPDRVWDRSTAFGSSLKALELLGTTKGYSLVYCNITGNNSFFVRHDLRGDRFMSSHAASDHYQTLKLFLLRPSRFPRTFKKFETPGE